MSECTHNCSTCSADCSSRNEIQKDPLNQLSSVKKVIGVISGKGGVGKSLVTSMLAVLSQRNGYGTAVLDADVTGPSIGQTFGVHKKVLGNDVGILPNISKTGIQLMSANFMLKEETDPVVWRGPVIAGVIKQFWSDVVWGELDYLFIDMPPGTGDVPLTVFQSLPIDGIVIVTSPQDLVSMIVKKASNMAKLMEIPVIGVVENMSYIVCPDCGKKMHIFGESKIKKVAEEMGVSVLAQMPINPELAHLSDEGTIENADLSHLDDAISQMETFLK